MDVTIVVATYGTQEWVALAHQRALPSARAQNVPVIHHHADTLHDARNGAVAQVETDWVIHLDADDELEPGYVEEMSRGSSDVRAPSVRYIQRAGQQLQPATMPRVAGHTHRCQAACLEYGNWLVVGSAVRTELVRYVGGWRDFPWSEDYDLWARCYLAGADIEAVPDAVYRAWVRRGSRNRSMRQAGRLEAHRAIARANGLPVP